MKSNCLMLHYNWRQVGNSSDDMGEDYDTHEVGKNGVVEIRMANPDTYSVIFDDGRFEVIYNPNHAFFSD